MHKGVKVKVFFFKLCDSDSNTTRVTVGQEKLDHTKDGGTIAT
jgi:hypothetical protein